MLTFPLRLSYQLQVLRRKKKKKRRKPLAEKGKKVHHSIKIHWDELNKKEYKTLPGKMLHGRNAYY